MRLLEHRRHSHRSAADPHLSPAGLALARRVGSGSPGFDRVVTSPRPRAVETAEAMGLHVDYELEALGSVPDAVSDRLAEASPSSFAGVVDLVERGGIVRRFANDQAELWATEVERVRDGGRLLLVSHAHLIELGTAAALPAAARSWGTALGYLEGVRLFREGGRWVGGEVLRIDPARA